MKISILLLLIVGTLISCESEAKEEFDVVISNVNLIDGTGKPLRQNINVYIKDSLIVRLDSISFENKVVDNIINGEGKYLIPGLIDGHTHPGNIQENFPRFIHYGVTGILVTGCGACSDEHFTEMRTLSAIDSIPSPKVYHTSQHFTMEGRHPIKTYRGDNWVNEKTVFLIEDTLQIEDYVRRVAENPIVGIKVTIEDGPDPPFVPRIPQEFVTKIVAEARKYDLEVFAHVSDMDEVMIAEKAGVQNIIHFLGVDIIPEQHEDIIESLGSKNTSWVTTLSLGKSFFYPLHPEWLSVPELVIAYPIGQTKEKITPQRIQYANEMIKYLETVMEIASPNLENSTISSVADIKFLAGKGCNVVIGTDTYNEFIFPGYSMHEEMQMMEMGGFFTPLEIIKMSSHNGAEMLGVLDKTGTIEIGKYADMVLLDKNPLETISNTLKINTVIKNGKVQTRME